MSILPPRNLKLNPRAIANNASLMQAVKDSKGGNHVARQRKMLWVEEGRGE